MYQTDSYLKEFTAMVTGLDPEAHAVILDQSAFYPGGGGQPCDRGTLTFTGRSTTVNKVKRVKGEVLHYLAESDPLPEVGAQASGKLDWELR